MARPSAFMVVVFAAFMMSVFLIMLELGRGGPARSPAAVGSVVISHDFHIVDDVAKIELSAGEYLTAVEGTTGHFGDGIVVTSLTFRTSRGKNYGPYGGSGTGTGTATAFSVPAASGCIVGFWGRSGRLLDAIGVYIKPCAPTISYNYPYPETGIKVTVSNKTFVFPELQ